MVKFDSITVGVIVGALCFLSLLLLGMVAWLYRKYQKLIHKQLDRVELMAQKVDVKTSTNQANIQANAARLKEAMAVARLEGMVEGMSGLVRNFSAELIRQTKEYALGQVRSEMYSAIREELELQQKKILKDEQEQNAKRNELRESLAKKNMAPARGVGLDEPTILSNPFTRSFDGDADE